MNMDLIEGCTRMIDAMPIKDCDETQSVIEMQKGRISALEHALKAAANIMKKKASLYNARLSEITRLKRAISDGRAEINKKDEAIGKIIPAICSVVPLVSPRNVAVIEAKVTIVLPVLNGGESLKRLFEKIKRQKRVPNVEIVMIDSGSTDGSITVAREYGARVVEIPGVSFNHGAARQLGVQHASGKYILYTVDDVMPTSDYWLFKVLSTLESNPEVAVLSVRQTTNGNADLYSKWVNERTYCSYGLKEDSAYFLKTPEIFDALPDQAKRRFSYIDDVCACYRKDVLMRYGFAYIPNAEDIELGVRMIKGGETLGFHYTNTIYHWHQDSPLYFLKRHYNGMKPFVSILGNEVPDMEGIYLHFLHDIGIKASNLFDALSYALEAWMPEGQVNPCDITAFLRLLEETITGLSNKKLTFKGKGAEKAGLKGLLDEICTGQTSDVSGNPFKFNWFAAQFNEQLQDLIKYYLDNYHDAHTGKEGFSDALFKIAASRVGDTLGYWYMNLEREGREGEMRGLDRKLARGVCFG